MSPKPAQKNKKLFALVGVVIALIVIVVLIVVATGSKSSSNSTANASYQSLITYSKNYPATNGGKYPTTQMMVNGINKKFTTFTAVDANNNPKAAKAENNQVSVLVSGGPLFAFGVYNDGVNGGKGGCVYASNYVFGMGKWGYGVGAPGQVCSLQNLNKVDWKKTAPAA